MRAAGSAARRAEQVPTVAGHVEEHGDPAVGLVARRRDELDAAVEHPALGSLEVVDAEEQPDSTGVLAADGTHLPVAIGLREEESRLRAGWPDDDPSLRPPAVRGRRRVLDELEAERVDEEPDRVVVALDDQRGVLEVQGCEPTAAVPGSS